jgi:small subunit ribosomal protein S1
MSTENILDMDLSELMDADFDKLVEIIEEHSISEQSVVVGKVLRIDEERVLIDINYKAEGFVSVDEFTNEDGELTISVGDTVEVYLERVDQEAGCAVISKSKADQVKAWEVIAQKFENTETIQGTITHRVKGGLSVDIGVKAFLPGSQVSLRPMKNLEQLLDRVFDFRIIKFNKKRGNIVLSRRALLEEKRRVERAKTLENLEIGNIMRGKVKNITEYGVFIDLGGIDGLLHITDMTWARINHPEEMVQKDDEIDVKILKFDPESQRVSLGHKQLFPNPWEDVESKYPVGCVVKGSIVNIEKYGIFVELEKGIEGLIHVTELSWQKRGPDHQQQYSVGEEVEALVKNVDLNDNRISLSIKGITSNPWQDIDVRYPVGSVISGKVRGIKEYGIFLEIEEGIDGLVHVSDLSWSKRDKNPSSLYSLGDEVTAKVKDIDVSNERLSLSIKDVSEDPWLSVQSRYFIGQVTEGKVASNTEFGVFVEIEDGVDGLIHETHLLKDKSADNYPQGSVLKVEILRIEAFDHRISLSEKNANNESGSVSDYIVTGGSKNSSIGDMFGQFDNQEVDEEESSSSDEESSSSESNSD